MDKAKPVLAEFAILQGLAIAAIADTGCRLATRFGCYCTVVVPAFLTQRLRRDLEVG